MVRVPKTDGTPQHDKFGALLISNAPAQGISYYTPAQSRPAGTAVEPENGESLPKLFQPLKLRGLTLQNRILLSPLCQYSCEDGHHSDWHFAHLGGIISRGPGLSFIEATAVLPEGRISPEDSGLWKDSQIEPLRRICEFVHSQNQKIGIQLAHAGRKASTVAPWLTMTRGPAAKVKSVNGWENDGFTPINGWPDDVVGPSPVAYKDKNIVPREMSSQDIEDLKTAWLASVKRALQAGFDAIEIHGGHGYLIHEFLSPVSNKRTDKYGGSFENRTRLPLELVDITRAAIPDKMPISFRISATDWLEHLPDIPSWTVDQSVEFAHILAARGVDLLDVSSAGNDPRQKIASGPGYQAPFAKTIKEAVGDKLIVGTVGSITCGTQANELLEEGIDLVLVGRMFQKNPGLVWQFAEDLDVQIVMPHQIAWGFGGASKRKK